MTDLVTAARLPPNSQEQPILDALQGLREKLSELRHDRSTYIKSEDVMSLYDKVMCQVHKLSTLRTGKPGEQNQVDDVLDDCFQLISLFFMTIGRNNEAPAVYATIGTTKRLLDHLAECNLFCAKDLESVSSTLAATRQVVERGRASYSPHLVKLLEGRLESCEELLAKCRTNLSILSPELDEIHEKLISILRSISAANTKTKFSSGEVKAFQDQLNEIRTTNKHILEPETVTDGQELVRELLERCLKWSDIVLERQGKIDEGFRPVYEKLRDIRNQLEKLSLTQAWSLRETDLFSFQREIERIDETRVNSNFVDKHGKPADLFNQRTLLYLVRRSYAYIYALIVSSEPISEALVPIYNQLLTLRRCLLEVQRSGGVSSPRELYPYSMKLNSIDNMRHDGKFMVGNDVPEGQANVVSLMEECFDLCYELRVSSEEKKDKEPEKDVALLAS